MNKELSNKITWKIAWGIAGAVVLVMTFILGTTLGEARARESALKSIAPRGVEITNEQLEPFWKVWSILNDKYVAATTTDTQKRIWGAIEGLASSQGDPYTVFFPPVENKEFKSEIAGNFEGVGMEIGIKDGILTVISPIKNSPAERAGVRAGDKIIKIDDASTIDMSVDQAVKLIRGTGGTQVKITFIREGASEPLEKTLTRATIDIPTLETEIRSDVFVIKLFSFTAQSPNLFRNALRDFLESGKNKLVIDLRGNPGGYLDAAWDIASWFLPSGAVIVTEDFGEKSKEENKVYKSKGYDVLNKFFGKGKYKVAILVNNGSASASEILAGALQEHGVAKLVGVTTFGKGSVQELINITPDTSLKVTVARWLTPKGHNLSKEGLMPDEVIEMTASDLEKKVDPQLNKALEILRK